jgi:hypothetical protein
LQTTPHDNANAQTLDATIVPFHALIDHLPAQFPTTPTDQMILFAMIALYAEDPLKIQICIDHLCYLYSIKTYNYNARLLFAIRRRTASSHHTACFLL